MKQRVMNLFAVKMGSHILSRKRDTIRELMVKSSSDGDKIIGRASEDRHGITAGEYRIGMRDFWCGVR